MYVGERVRMNIKTSFAKHLEELSKIGNAEMYTNLSRETARPSPAPHKERSGGPRNKRLQAPQETRQPMFTVV